ncbi:accessory factor associated with RNA polymerase II [Geranomyces michiganensis]|nr:accessory factor associated with RNA polymerase II [Geranomyces michiganensis]
MSAPSGFKDYDVKCLLHFYQSREIPFADYVKASADDARSLNFMDRKEVLDLLDSDPAAPRKDIGGMSSAKRPLEGGAGADDVKRPRLVLDPKDVAFVKEVKARERIVSNDYGTTSLRVSTKQTFTSLIELAKKRMTEKHRKGPAQAGPGRGQPDSRRPNPTQGARVQPQTKPSSRHKASSESRIPIIIVPSVPTARLTLWNVKQFLAETSYVPTQKFIDSGTAKSVSVRFERQLRPGQHGGIKFPTTYQVVDSPDNIKPEDWPRVVAAFVTGQAWQFGRWKYKDPSHLFAKIKGFCLKYTDEPAPGDVDKWAVTKLDISRGIRHNDYNAVNKFWDHVDAFMLRDKQAVSPVAVVNPASSREQLRASSLSSIEDLPGFRVSFSADPLPAELPGNSSEDMRTYGNEEDPQYY